MCSGKKLRRLIAASLTVGSLLFSTGIDSVMSLQIVHAEVRTYTGVGKCNMGDLATPAQAKNYARLRAEQNAKEQAGEFISSYARVNNFRLVESEIELMSGSIINIIGDVVYTQKPFDNDGVPTVVYTATLKANIDSDGINAYIRRRNSGDNGQGVALSQIASATKDINDNLDKIDSLSEQYNQATTQRQKDNIRAEFEQSDEKLLAAQKLEEGNVLSSQGKYREAMEIYNQAIQIDSNFAYAYNNRGIVYSKLKEYNKATADFNKAIQLDLNHVLSYNNRGNVYDVLKEYNKAITDYNKAIQLDPNYYWAYNNRGGVYYYLKDYTRAIADLDKAIQLDPNNASAYNNRGFCYQALGVNTKAQADFAKAKELGYNG